MAELTTNENVKPLPENKVLKPGYTPTGKELEVWDQYKRRKQELLNSRRNVYGLDIDEQMRRFDRNYFNRIADIPSAELDADQKPLAINNAFGKVQSALGILIDRNPEIVLEENNPKYSANRELMKGLAKSSWKNTNSLGQFKLSIFNCAKRGWFAGRTYHKHLTATAKFPMGMELDKETGKEKEVWETKEITKCDDVAYLNLNNFNVWIDEQTRPEDFFSTRDWMWREVWHIDDIKKLFPEEMYPNMKFVVAGGDTRETIYGTTNPDTGAITTANEAKETKQGMTEIFFYENQYDDWFIAEIHGVMVCWKPLPQNSKRLSLVYGYWNLRGAETIYGIGIVEEMERNEQLIDRVVNMTLRQLLLTIAPPGFYTGTEDPEDENLKYTPGKLRRIMDPKNITFLEIPEGNKNGIELVNWLEAKEDQMTGVTKALEGDPTSQEGGNDTAFALGVNRESGLKRLKLPLKSFQYALDWEFRNRIDLIKQVYSDFHVRHIASEEDIFAYLDEVNADPEFYFIENDGNPDEEKFYTREYREMQLNLEQDDKGNFIESENKKFFRIKPQYLAFEGDVTVDANSMLVQSEELEKADTLRMANIILPLLAEGDPAVVGRPVKQILQAFNKDARKWLPDAWLQAMNQVGKIAKNENINPRMMSEGGEGKGIMDKFQNMKAETVVPQSQVDGKVSLGNRMSAAFNAFKNPF